jgi:hypothetical protein
MAQQNAKHAQLAYQHARWKSTNTSPLMAASNCWRMGNPIEN